MKPYEFQINLGYTEKLICGCGIAPNKKQTELAVRAYTAPSLRMLLRKIIHKTGLRVEQIVLTFAPGGPQP